MCVICKMASLMQERNGERVECLDVCVNLCVCVLDRC